MSVPANFQQKQAERAQGCDDEGYETGLGHGTSELESLEMHS